MPVKRRGSMRLKAGDFFPGKRSIVVYMEMFVAVLVMTVIILVHKIDTLQKGNKIGRAHV